jgi:hypothetical protein
MELKVSLAENRVERTHATLETEGGFMNPPERPLSPRWGFSCDLAEVQGASPMTRAKSRRPCSAETPFNERLDNDKPTAVIFTHIQKHDASTWPRED